MREENFTTIQELRRNYKKVKNLVDEINMPIIVISNNRPQFAIISMKMLENIKK